MFHKRKHWNVDESEPCCKCFSIRCGESNVKGNYEKKIVEDMKNVFPRPRP